MSGALNLVNFNSRQEPLHHATSTISKRVPSSNIAKVFYVLGVSLPQLYILISFCSVFGKQRSTGMIQFRRKFCRHDRDRTMILIPIHCKTRAHTRELFFETSPHRLHEPAWFLRRLRDRVCGRRIPPNCGHGE